MEFGDHLKQWRSHRHLSQMDLALEAGISSRHLSFLETGRARPSEGMIIRICEALELPYRIQNELFHAAGFAPRYFSAEREGVAGLPVLIRDTLHLILEKHEPWPAVAFNADYDILASNTGFSALAAALGISVAPGINILALVLEPGAVREAIVNWPEVALLFLKRARNEARLYGPGSGLARRVANYENDAEIAALLRNDEGERNPPPVITARLRLGDIMTNWITTLTAFGAAQEVLTEGIFIEQYFPADDATRAIARKCGSLIVQLGVSLPMQVRSKIRSEFMPFFLSVLAVTTVLGSMIGAIQTGAKIWQGGIISTFGLSAIGLFYIMMSVIYPRLSTNPVLAVIVFFLAVEFAAVRLVLDREQAAGVAGGALMLTTISGVFLAAAG